MVESENIKLSIAVAGENALPSAFVVFRGFEDSLRHAAHLGYDGIELALKTAKEINISKLSKMLEQYNMEVSCISTGQVFAESGLMFTDSDIDRRNLVKKIFTEFIDLASVFGQKVNIGRVRGSIEKNGDSSAEDRFIEMVRVLSDYAITKDVTLLIEPVNRYEINFINSVEEGVDSITRINCSNVKLMPDVFHMNIEDASIGNELIKHIDHISYIHLADSNRLAPGWGHTDFDQIFNSLRQVNYNGWLSVEILPKPNPYAAAKQAIDFLRPYYHK